MKRRLLILLISICMISLLVTSCAEDIIEEIAPPQVVKLELVANTVPTQCNLGETPDFSNIKAIATYDDGTTKEVGFADVTISKLDTTTPGEKTVTVSFGGRSAKFSVVVVDPELVAEVVGINIVAKSMRSKYFIQEAVDYSKLQVEATYNNGREADALLASEYTYTTIDTSTPGQKTFTVTYKNFSASMTVEVFDIAQMFVVENSVAKKINVGETLNTSGLQLQVLYEGKNDAGDNIEIVSADKLKIGNIDSSTYGNKLLSITYKGVTYEYPVHVVGAESLVVDSYATEVFVGAEYDKDSVLATVKYSDGLDVELTANDLTIVIDTSVTGKKTMTVSYGELSTTAEVSVIGVATMNVVTGSIATEILKGNTLTTSGLQVTGTYTNGKTFALSADQLTIGAFDTSVGGNQDLSITYLDKTITHTVKVCVISSIVVEGVPKVLSAGTKIDLANMKVYGVYNDSLETRTTEPLASTDITTNVDNIDINSEENKTLVVTYNGTYGTFTKDVIISTTEPLLASVEIRNYDKAVGQAGEYNKDNVVVYAHYANGTEERLTAGYTVSDVVTTTAGDVTLKVTYTEGDIEKTAEVTVKVLPITGMEVSGIESVVDKNGTLDTSGVVVTVTFSDGAENTLTRVVTAADGVTVSTPDTTVGGVDNNLTVSYLGSNKAFTYHVRGVASIEIMGGSVDTELRQGYAVEYSQLKLKITYTDGTVVTKYASELSGVTYDGTQAGSTMFSVTYEGQTATQALTEIGIFVDSTGLIPTISALNGTVPAEIRQGAELDYDAMRLSVTYFRMLDATTPEFFVYLVPLTDAYITVSPEHLDTTTPGEKSITFTYSIGGVSFSTTVNIEVIGVSNVEIVSGVYPSIIQNKKVDTDNISVKVTYTNGTYTYLRTGANGLIINDVDTSAVGTTTLTVEYLGVKGTKAITVVEAPSVDGIVFGALKPDELVARESYAKNFKDSTSAYRVGDDNKYYFYLNVVMLDENDNLVDIDGKDVATTAKIFLVEGGSERELTGDELKSYVAFTSAENAYDFTEAAIGKTFRLEIKPASLSYMDESVVTKTHTVTVVDGYNIYHAYELNVMTNTNYDVKSGSGEAAVVQSDAATAFLLTKGIVKPETLGGIVLHCNLDVKIEDLPSEYFYKYKDKNGQEQLGLYDQFGLFSHALTLSQPNFEIYGNYYTVYSYNIPPVVPKGVANNPDDYSSSDLFKIKAAEETYWQVNYNIGADQMIFDGLKANIRDISTRDNDPNSNDQSASERHMRGIICYKIGDCNATMTNVNVEAYMTSLLVDNANTTMNLDKVNFYNAWQGHLFIWNDNYVQRQLEGYNKETPTAAWARDAVVNITDSSLTKCGGPVIIAQNASTEYMCSWGLGIQVNVDAVSDLHTYVTGQEAWFVAVGQTQLAAQIRAMSALIGKAQGQPVVSGHGYISTDKIQGTETINMVMVSMGTGISFDGSESYNGSFVKGNEVGMKMSNGKTDRAEYQNPMLTGYLQATSQLNGGTPAPVFQSSAGGTAFTDGQTGCYGIDFSNGSQVFPENSFFGGNYLSLYYMGVGIMVEYVHN